MSFARTIPPPRLTMENRKNFAHAQHPHPHALQANGMGISPGHLAGPIPLPGGVEMGQPMEGFPMHQQCESRLPPPASCRRILTPSADHPHPVIQVGTPSVGTGGFYRPMSMPMHVQMPIRPMGWTAGNPPPPTHPPPVLTGAPGGNCLQIQVRNIDDLNLAPFIRRPKLTKFGVDLSYLKAKGANLMLNARIQNVLIRGYIEYVHPYMPLVDLHEFIAGLCGEGPQISLLLYNAIAFAGSAFVDATELKAAGFPGRREARKILFTRTRVSRRSALRLGRLLTGCRFSMTKIGRKTSSP